MKLPNANDSKVFGLIDRFSEDIDISIDRAALGFSGERDLANPLLSGTKRKALDEELRAAPKLSIFRQKNRSKLFF
ncbi:MAG TPA: nucleotidyl transferase AbiEii/AbiGii toxin family protein [Candidatus Dormibacteraeota bacterium]|nr:nucleotidyl transferase AbiEii/AbiGii toxin family protein [Candidatus Dormibacteraeota bacterium]